ncbi:T9SS type A sorting domain-containing protein [Aquimarina sp. 2201CG14-23]|uniref:T9SS type A sorting domain-containing protein n=1 Tax=Aquimarina mycalae TaxID=3040073 RepID=UPI00247819A4|nr:T9SS type A sorting domain-containing protein [Aquimarina sp. 2201CG14-23]MDH7444892.1 T9SS type A sorting domain-containing protein [Aquimarina sp. 2201CG14-23]
MNLKKLSSLLAIGCVLFLMCYYFVSNSRYTLNSQNTNLLEKKDKLPNDLLFMQRAYPNGEIKSGAIQEGIAWKRQTKKNSKRIANVWEFTGPLNIGGRITDIEIPSGSTTTLYVGAASGGVFRSTDNAASWQPIFDDQPMLSIGDIEISKTNNNLVYVGTGEVNAGGGSLAYDGDGVYKSIDGGDTWESKGLQDVGSISKIIIDPMNNDQIYVGAMGPLFRNDNNRGVYRSTDGGDSWEKVLFISAKTGVIDMAIHPTNSNIVYAVTWERERTPQNRTYGGPTSGIYRSIDGGDNWTELTTGLPTNGNLKGRISIDISQSNPNVLYASYADAIGNIQGVYRTSDGGDNWITVNSNQLTNVGFHWWFGGLFIDPSDEDIVYHVGFDMQKTEDGGMNWQNTFINTHVDQHALAFNPINSNEVFLGNDGGLFRTTNSGDSYTKDLKLPITQFYRFYVDPQNNNRLYGGCQDNSTIRTTTGGLSDWSIINGGDGFQPLVNNTNSSIIYALSQRGFLSKSIDDAASFNLILNGIDPSDRNNWDTPIAFDSADNSIMYYGTNRLYQSTDSGDNWVSISADLTNGSGMGNLNFGTITTIDVSPIDSDIIYVGTDDGNVWSTVNGGTSWTNISSTLPNRWVTRVQASPNTVNTVYVTFSGYRYGEDNGHVFSSNNNGANWTDLSSGLPDIPVSDIEIDEFDNLFLGTDIGVLASSDAGVSWNTFGDNMPSVVVTDLHIDEATGFLYAGTYGRSSYRININQNVLNVEDVVLNENTFSVYPNPAKEKITISLNEFLAAKKVTIYNQLGQIQKTFMLDEKNKQIDIRDLSSGLYILKVGEVGANSSKFIKK